MVINGLQWVMFPRKKWNEVHQAEARARPTAVPTRSANHMFAPRPRNGHISLYSRDALYYLADNEGLNFASFSPNLHAFWRTIPPWAAHILQ